MQFLFDHKFTKQAENTKMKNKMSSMNKEDDCEKKIFFICNCLSADERNWLLQ